MTLSTHIKIPSNRVQEVIEKAEALLDLVQKNGVIFPLVEKQRLILKDIRDCYEEEADIALPFGTFALDDFERTQEGAPRYRPKGQISLSVTPLILAAAEGRDDVISILLEFADIDEQPKESSVTALFMALICGHAKTARMLLDRGAQLRACDRNALYAAARSGLNDVIVRLVREFRVDLDVEDDDGAMPIIYALQLPEEKAATTIMLLRHLGALGDLDIVDDWTIRDLACVMGKESLALVSKANLLSE